jgi:hypothetical protein
VKIPLRVEVSEVALAHLDRVSEASEDVRQAVAGLGWGLMLVAAGLFFVGLRMVRAGLPMVTKGEE